MAASGTTTVERHLGDVTVGSCIPSTFPASAIEDVLVQAGHSLAFSQDQPAAALKECRSTRPDLFLLGVRRPDSDCLKFVSEILEASASTRVILICDQAGGGAVRKALDAGIGALVTAPEVGEALPAVIDVVMAGQVSVPNTQRAELRKEFLTMREKQILGLVVMGMSNAEIATQLYLAESTVKSHLSSAFSKLGVGSRNEAAALIIDPQSGVGPGILTIPTD
jgi:two-component system nitrate/nitrite response regulator NarL